MCAALDARLRAAPAAAEPLPALVTVVGDVLLDRDVDGVVTRLCPDTPVPVVDTLEVRQSPGGAGLTAVLCAQQAHVRLVAPIAADAPAAELTRLLTEHVDLVPLPQEGSTRRKTRVRSGGQTVVRVDDGGPARPGHVPPAELDRALADTRVLLVSDYGAGVTYDGPVREAIAAAALTTPVVWDPHPRGGPPVAGTAIVTPNLAEAVSMAAELHLDVDPDDVGGLAQALCRSWDAGAVAVTAGDRGAFLAQATGSPVYVPAHPARGDACGAGDRFAASVAIALAQDSDVLEAVVRAVGAASAWVEAGGADGFRRRSRADAGTDAGAAQPASSPAAQTDATVADVERLGSRLRETGTVVATGGCFDIVHAGHVATLEAAARLGDSLVVLLNSDDSVRRLKGPSRPVIPQADRARLLAALDCVTEVVIFDEDDPGAVLDRLRPDVWAKGGDYVADDLPESAVVRGHGGRVVVLPFVEGRSTTAILDRSARSSASRTSTARPTMTPTAATSAAPATTSPTLKESS
nr:PfkB family carbohydrate kinase [Sanguibacter suarezii]